MLRLSTHASVHVKNQEKGLPDADVPGWQVPFIRLLIALGAGPPQEFDPDTFRHVGRRKLLVRGD